MKFKYIGTYVTRQSGCGCNGSLRRWQELDTTIASRIVFTMRQIDVFPQDIFDVTEIEEAEIKIWIEEKKYSLEKVV